MNVVVIHNFYQQPGGEDEVFRAETDLLSGHGHRVVQYTKNNHDISGLSRSALATGAVWNRAVYRELREVLRRERADIAHFHNTSPLVSPSGYYAARAEGVGVVQTLHNFRLICPNGLLFRDGHVCEECVGRFFPWPGIVHACYRKSRQATAVRTAMLTLHKPLRTWSKAVGMYVALSEFSRQKFIEGGIPAEKLVVKPNFLMGDPGLGEHRGSFALFVGRLSHEKGLGVLQRAWGLLGDNFALKILGGPLTGRETASPCIEWLGPQPKERVYAEMKAAAFLVFPSECYENCPMTIIEAFATGLPVIVSGRGSPAEMVRDYEHGCHFRAGDPVDLAAKLQWAFTHSREMAVMGHAGRQQFETRYSAMSNYGQLMQIYNRARMV
jgi:glycosyltransferase involved in cell wall biosynthesis